MEDASDRDGGSEGTHSITVSAAQVSQLAQQIVSLRGGAGGGQQVTVLQLPSGEQVQVHGVIQAAAPSSVIRSPAPPQHILSAAQQPLEDRPDEEQAGSPQPRSEDSQQKAARELLARRPSYRKILKELSGGERGDEEQLQHLQEEQESAGASTALAASMAAATTTIYQTSTGQYFAIAPNGALQFASPAADTVQGLQTLSMSGGGDLHQHLGGAGTTILQYAQTSDGQQILVPSNQVVVQTPSGDMQTYQIRTTTAGGGGSTTSALPQTVLMSSPLALSSAAAANAKTVDPQLKREIRLMKNMEAARECRRKKKEYVKCLENRVAVLENQNRTLIEELKTLKDLYCHK